MNSNKVKSSASRRTVFVVSLAAGLTLGCASAPESEESLARQSEELAWGWTDRIYWQTGETITTCFTGPNTADRALAQDVLERTWGVAANLHFDFTGSCPATIPTSTFSIYLRKYTDPADDGKWGGMGEPGKNHRLPTDEPNWSPMWENRSDLQLAAFNDRLHSDDFYRHVIVHEVGHTLGFYHEQLRDDNLHACTIEPSAGDTTGWLTPYDPVSVMNYCAEFYGRNPDDFSLTAFDLLGAEIMYPHDFARKPVVPNAFSNSAGTTYIARRNVPYVLVPDWVAKGATPSAFTEAVWWQNGLSFTSTLTAPRTFTTEGDQVFEVYVKDIRGRSHLDRPPVTVTVNDSKHTAIVMAAI